MNTSLFICCRCGKGVPHLWNNDYLQVRAPMGVPMHGQVGFLCLSCGEALGEVMLEFIANHPDSAYKMLYKFAKEHKL